MVRNRLFSVCVCAGLSLGLASWCFADGGRDSNKLKSLPPEQKEELLRKKERFDSLSDEEKRKLRELHDSITKSQDAPELEKVMTRFCDWLKTLSSGQRAELLDLPPDKRIARIKEIMSQQEAARFREYTGNLPENDRDRIYKFLEEFIARHEDQIKDRMPRELRDRLRHLDEEGRKRMLIGALQNRRNDSDMPFPAREDFEKLLANLSPETQKQLEQARTPEEKQERTRELVRAAIWSRMFPPVSEEELRKFYTGLPVEARERLEPLDPEQMNRELRRMYYADKFRERGPWGEGGPRGGPPRGGPGRGGPPDTRVNDRPGDRGSESEQRDDRHRGRDGRRSSDNHRDQELNRD